MTSIPSRRDRPTKICTFCRATILSAILLLGLTLRLAPWGQNRFLEDEALYAAWGLKIAAGADPLLSEEPVDKPPLHLYALALSFTLFASPPRPGEAEGGLETAARLPSLFASVTSIALTYALAKSLYPRRRNATPARVGSQSGARARTTVRARQGAFSPNSQYDVRVGLLAALLLALSPFDILFASTAFTDPLLVAWVLAALLAAVRGRLGAAGLLIGLAAATKQQGLLFLPLVIALGAWGTADRQDGQIKGWLRFVLGFGLAAAGVLWWDAARGREPGFWQQGVISYGGLGPAQPEALGERAVAWLRLVGGFWESPGFNVLLLAAGIWYLVSRNQGAGIRAQKPGSPIPDTRYLLLAVFVVGFLALHWLMGFQVWDRYLLGLVPLAALLAARAFVDLTGCAQRNLSGLTLLSPVQGQWAAALGLGLVLIVSLSGPALQATRSELPYGGDHGAYDGIDDLAEYLRQNAPPGAVLYHHWLGYHYRFYLRGAPLRRHWYPDPADLVHDAYVYRREPRYIAFPSFRDGSAAQEALRKAGIELALVFEARRRDGTVSFRLYRLEGPGNW